MKQRSKFYGILLVSCMISIGATTVLYGQGEKQKVRVSLNYTGIMPGTSQLAITAKYRGENGFEPAADLGFEVFNVLKSDSLVAIGTTKTDHQGTAIFALKDLGKINADSTGTYNFMVSSLEHPNFSEVEKSIAFKLATLDAYLSKEDDLSYLKATLTDDYTGVAVADVPLKVQVQRLFRPMRIGDEFYMTDASGSIRVPVESGIPGINGKLTLEVVLTDNDNYGTLKAMVEAPLGVPITDQSSFDQRTMWGPPSKTPLFLLTFPNLMILGIWGTIVLLFVNLYKIYKSEN